MAEFKPIPGSTIFNALHDEHCIVMACNTRIVPGTVKGILRAAKDMDAAVIFELARSECDLSGGYTGLTPKDYAEKTMKISKEVGHDIWALHADHIGIKKGDTEDIQATKELVKAQIEAGFTMFAIDASHLFDFDAGDTAGELAPNIEATTTMAEFITQNMGENDFGLEVEVGEIGRTNDDGLILTTPDQAVTFIKKLTEAGVKPHLLAIANGSTHGNIYDSEGKIKAQVSIDIDQTKAIAKALKDNGFTVKIAQHGITGTPREFIKTMFPHGDLLKGNVGTFWQNIVHETLKVYEPDLWEEMRKWTLETFKDQAAKKGLKTEEQIIGTFGKKATKQFFDKIYNLRTGTVAAIEARAYAEALMFFEAFNARGSAGKVREWMKKNWKK